MNVECVFIIAISSCDCQADCTVMWSETPWAQCLSAGGLSTDQHYDEQLPRNTIINSQYTVKNQKLTKP